MKPIDELKAIRRDSATPWGVVGWIALLLIVGYVVLL